MPADACRAIYAASKRYSAASAANFTSVSVERDEVFPPPTARPRQIAAQTPMVTGGASGAYKGMLTIGISGLALLRSRRDQVASRLRVTQIAHLGPPSS